MKPQIVDYVIDAVRRPHEKLTRGQHQLRYAWDLAWHCWRQLMRHRAEGMAAELTYRTIFSLIPVVVLGLVMFRVVGGLDEVQDKISTQLYSFFGVPEIPEQYLVDLETESIATKPDEENSGDLEPKTLSTEIEPAEQVATVDLTAPANTDQVEATNTSEDETGDPSPNSADSSEEPIGEPDPENATPESENVAGEPSEEEAAAAQAKQDRLQREETRRQTRASIRKTLREVVTKVASIDFASIGAIGLMLFVYAAVALAHSVEYLFNVVFDAPKQRPLHIRLAIHWSIITLGSGLLAMSLYLSGQVLDWFVTLGAGSNLKWFLAHALSILASWVLLFLLYALMPNTHVSVKAAAVGALVGSLLWEGAKFAFQIYVVTAVPYSALYGSMGLIPLFLFWIYITWLIVLFGLILTYTLQTLRGKRFHKEDWKEQNLLSGDPDWMLPIMCEVSRAFDRGDSVDQQELADHLGLTSRIVNQMTGKLVEARMLRKVSAGAGEEDSLTLGKPAEQIGVAEILTLAHQTAPTSDHPAWKTLANLKEAERKAARERTLADVSRNGAF